MTLSPAAQSVLDAVKAAYFLQQVMAPSCGNLIAAAALRAAVEQVLPHEPQPPGYLRGGHSHIQQIQRQHARAKFLAIATELENAS